jgi:hypothetical protein
VPADVSRSFACQAAALCRLAGLVRAIGQTEARAAWPEVVAAAMSEAVYWTRKLCSDSAVGCTDGSSGSHRSDGGSGGNTQQRPQQQRCMQQAAFMLGHVAVALLPSCLTDSLDLLEQDPSSILLTSLAQLCYISPDDLRHYVQVPLLCCPVAKVHAPCSTTSACCMVHVFCMCQGYCMESRSD